MASALHIAINIIGPIFLVIGISMVIGRRFNPDPRTLSSLLIYLFTPCLILDGIAKSSIQPEEVGGILIMVILITVILLALGLLVSRLLKFDSHLENAFLLCIILVNAANYGLPLNEFAFGLEGRQRATVYYAITVLVSNNLGIFVIARGQKTARQAMLSVLKVPLLYAGLAGFALNAAHLTLPLPLDRAVGILSQATVPVMIVLLGLHLIRVKIKGRLGPVLLASSIRLIIAPIVAALIAVLFGLTGVTRSVAIVESSMPTAVLAIAIASEFGGDEDFTSATILISTVASIFTLTILLALLMGN
jgi:malate permease and related proteins